MRFVRNCFWAALLWSSAPVFAQTGEVPPGGAPAAATARTGGVAATDRGAPTTRPEPRSRAKGGQRRRPVKRVRDRGASRAARSRARPAARSAARKQRRNPRGNRGGSYEKLKRSWQEPVAPWQLSSTAAALVPGLVMYPVAEDMPVVIIPEGKEGGFSEPQLAIATRAFGSWEGGPSVHPRLLSLLYQAMRQFKVPHVHLISGIRRDRSGSRHSHGLAADVVFPGVGNEKLAAHFRARGFVGVGTYPRSGFVHVDVRERSYFWVDHSAPGRRGKQRPVLQDEAQEADKAARARGEEPIHNPARLARVMAAREKRRRDAHRAKQLAKRRRQRQARATKTGTDG